MKMSLILKKPNAVFSQPETAAECGMELTDFRITWNFM